MKSSIRSKVISALLFVCILLGVGGISAGADSAVQETQAPLHVLNPVVLRYSPVPSANRVPPPLPASGQLGIQSATITVNYKANGTTDVFGNTCYTWDTNAQIAFSYAAGIWATLITSTVPIVIDACWTQFADPNTLGVASPDYVRNTSTNTWYAVSLANAISGADQNGGTAETFISYNRTPPVSWYFGTDGNPGGSSLDFASVVLHEITHGLGFAGSMRVSGGVGIWGGYQTGNTDPARYDRFTEKGGGGSGTPLLSYTYGSAALATALTSQDVFFDGPNANAANGGTPPELYAPATWKPGSSYSHLDEGYNGTANALMTYSIGPGESEHDPGPVTMGMLQDMGWSAGAPVLDKKVYLPLVLRNYGQAITPTPTLPATGPTPGFWESTTGDEFYVTTDRAYVDNFAIYISVTGCGNYKITHTPLEPIVSNQFSFTGPFYASGTFHSATTASGVDGLSGFNIPGCGTVNGGPWSWNATWQDSSQPSVRPAQLVKPDTVESVTTEGEFYKITPIK